MRGVILTILVLPYLFCAGCGGSNNSDYDFADQDTLFPLTDNHIEVTVHLESASGTLEFSRILICRRDLGFTTRAWLERDFSWNMSAFGDTLPDGSEIVFALQNSNRYCGLQGSIRSTLGDELFPRVAWVGVENGASQIEIYETQPKTEIPPRFVGGHIDINAISIDFRKVSYFLRPSDESEHEEYSWLSMIGSDIADSIPEREEHPRLFVAFNAYIVPSESWKESANLVELFEGLTSVSEVNVPMRDPEYANIREDLSRAGRATQLKAYLVFDKPKGVWLIDRTVLGVRRFREFQSQESISTHDVSASTRRSLMRKEFFDQNLLLPIMVGDNLFKWAPLESTWQSIIFSPKDDEVIIMGKAILII